ncbi:MAG TPA: GNAT family N-acetyltransferase [Roseiarcus sp.]|nr:GNAT family N-acetyltransferase [Roseiarcus sp.]
MRCRTLDELPWSRRYSVGPALTSEIGRLVALAVPEIPAMRIIEPAIRRVHERNPDSILAVRGRKGLEGGVALLHLNRQGLAALLDGTFAPAEPRLEHLTLAHETPAAIYGWALYLPGLLVAALGNVMRLLQSPRYAAADIYARPATFKAEGFQAHVGFAPCPGGPEGLNVYRRSSAAAPQRPEQEKTPRRNIEIKIGHGAEDLLMVYSIRSAVYLAEQACPYAEEFDGNDWVSTHFIGFVDGEPACSLRARYFGDFVKLERLAVRKEFRTTRVAFDVVRAAVRHVRRKGFRRIYGHAREGLEKFWAHFGAKPLERQIDLIFSDFRYTEMYAEYPPLNDAITIESGPYVIIRPEGEWDQPGPLEASRERPARRPEPEVERRIRAA